MTSPAKTKPLSRRPSKANVDPANHTSPSEINSSAAFRAPPEPYYSLDTSIDKTGSKKRKIERACDFCRRRKTKCDGPKMPEFRCTNCIQNGRDCTYVEVSKPRGPPKAYIQGMEDRMERLETLLKRLRPELDLVGEVGPPVVRDSWKADAHALQSTPSRQTSLSSHSQPSSSLVPPQPSLAVSSGAGVSHAAPYPGAGPIMIALTHASSRDTMRSSPALSDEEEPSSASSSDNEDYGELSLIRGMQSLSMRPLESHEGGTVPDSQWRFHGKSSSFKLINTAWKLQNEASKVTGEASPEESAQKMGLNRRPYFWKSPEYEATRHFSDRPILDLLKKRFPSPELLPSLMDGYFKVMNDHFPLLHRPTFEKQLKDRLYERDIWFGCLCMAVFGVGARWAKIPEVLWDDDKGLSEVPDPSSPLWGSAGWKYIQITFEIHRNHSDIILPACLFEIQSYHLIGLFLRSTSYYSDAWKIVSLGLRRAQDVGAHRKKVYSRNRTAEDELWKRAYWCLVTFDRLGSVINGRPCASRDEDSDLEMPLQVDDEYWESEDPNLAFRQPPDKPCRKAFFVCWIKLTQIAGFALRTLYAIGKSKIPLGLVGTRWREETLSRLNEALSQWVAELPPYLRWSTKVKDDLFATQATTLITTYYMVVIFIHKPFIPMPFATGSFGGFQSSQRHSLVDRPDFPWTCLSICTNAAKATAQIWNAHVQHRRFINMTSLANSSYISAGALLVHVWLVRAMEKAEGPRVSEERRQFFTTRMNDLMEHLQILITRLEEISSGFEIAREWLKEIKNSLPPEGLSPQPSSSQPHVAESYAAVNTERNFTPDAPYDFSRPETFGGSGFAPDIPPYAATANTTGFVTRQEELAYAVPSTNSLVASTPMSFDSSSSLANALYPFNPAQSWEASRTDTPQVPISAASRRFSQGHLFQSTLPASSRGLMRRASLAPTATTTDAVGPLGDPVQSLRQHRSSSDLHGFTPTVPSQGMPSPYTASDHSSLPMDQQSNQSSPASHYGYFQSQYSMYQPGTQGGEVSHCLKREQSNSSLRELYGPMDGPAMPVQQPLHSTSPSPMLHTSRSQGSLHQQWAGNFTRNTPVYRSEGSWRNFSSHASNPDLKGRRNSSFSPHPNPHSHSNQNPSSYSPHSHSPHSHMGASGLPGMATPPESQHPPPHTQLRNVGYSHGTLYTPMEGEQSTSTSGGWAPRNSFSGPS